MKVVDFLQEGWYRNSITDPVIYPCCKQLVNCRKLCVTRKDIAATRFILFCDGISGTIDALVVDDTFKCESVIPLVNRLVVGLTRVELDDSEFCPEEHV